MESKTKLILDFDNTIVNSTKAFCNAYNNLFKNKYNFVQSDWTKSQVYNFSDVCPLLKTQEQVFEIFETSTFFHKLKFMESDTKQIIKELSELFNVYICTIGTHRNLYLKSKWITKNLPFIKQHIFLTTLNGAMDKSIVNMKDAIFIDDHYNNLKTSNAKVKISFGKRFEWNNNWKGIICSNWQEVYDKLIIDNFQK